MLKKLSIGKFKSCENVEISDIRDFLVLVGKNGVGKTNIFRALAWVARVNQNGGITGENSVGLDGYRLSLEILLGGKTLIYDINVDVKLVNGSNPSIEYYITESLYVLLLDSKKDLIFTRKDGEVLAGMAKQIRLPIGETSLAASLIVALLPSDIATPMIEDFLQFMSGISYNHLDTPSSESCARFVSTEDYLKWKKSPSASQNLPSETEMRLLDLKISNKTRFNELTQLLGQMGIVDSLEIIDLLNSEEGNPKIYIFQWRPKFQANSTRAWMELSFGTRRLIKLFVTFFYQDDCVFMLEQPEDGIHAGLLHEILPMLRAYAAEKQIFIATHSPEVMNSAHPNEIRIVHSNSGVTSARNLSIDELADACAYLQNDGPLYNFISMIEG